MERETIVLCQFEKISENGTKHHYKCKWCGFEIDSIFPPDKVRRVCDVVRLDQQPVDQSPQAKIAERIRTERQARKPCNCGKKH